MPKQKTNKYSNQFKLNFSAQSQYTPIVISKNIFFDPKKIFFSLKTIKLKKLFLKFSSVSYLNKKIMFLNQTNNV